MASTTLVSSGSGGGGNNYEDFERDLEALLRDHQEQQQQLRRAGVGRGGGGLLGRPRGDLLDIHRSGSAPPTFEGSLSAIGNLFGGQGLVEHVPSGELTEEEIRAHPEYLSYYYSNGNFNPRMPPPTLSREDWRAVQRFRGSGSAFGGIGDRRVDNEKTVGHGGNSYLSGLQPMGAVMDRDGVRIGDREAAAEWSRSVGAGIDSSMRGTAKWIEHTGDGLTGLPAAGLGSRRMNFTDASQAQDELSRCNYVSSHSSHAPGRNALNDTIDPRGISDVHKTQLPNECETVDAFYPGNSTSGLVRVQSLQSLGSSHSHPAASAQSSSFAMSADPQLLRRYPSPCLPSMRSNFPADDISSSIDHDDIAAAFVGLNIPKSEPLDEESLLQRHLHPQFIDEVGGLFSDANQYLDQSNNKLESESVKVHPSPMPYKDPFKRNGILRNQKLSKVGTDGQNYPHKRSSLSLPLATQNGVEGPSNQPNGGSRGSNVNGFLAHHQIPEIVNNPLNGGAACEVGQDNSYLASLESQVGSGLQDPFYAQYLSKIDSTAETATLKALGIRRNSPEASLLEMAEYKKAYNRVLLEQQKLQSGMPFLGNSVGLLHGYFDNNPTLDFGLPYSPNPLLPSVGSGGSIRQSDRLPRVTSLGRSATAGSIGSWNLDGSIREAGIGSSLLREFKTNKTRNFELLDIVNHVYHFSIDQYGSRFIQQKLETASVEEKNKIFPEILLCARELMSDVFGNYVIQKFFEHGTQSQRMQLASQLTGQVLDLSLQMYGCRVIQKALEVVDLEHQTQMVSELDGSIMKCVRDQNGNHVIQKCIECVPQERIQFIISCFYGQVVTLSTHPYGCRVIQRVLEHCHDSKTQDIMMQEILASVSILALDQYGNYVVQHVLQHGKPVERSAIISKLIGNIVDMSLQKFASNVIEKCLTHGSPEERQLLINEVLGSTDENEPLQRLMKDQYGNYVVQKILETCDDKNRELIVSRIKVHLNALKKYTYGKHIVARVEKLVATGERHTRVC